MTRVLEYARAPLPAERGINPLSDSVSAAICSSRYTALSQHRKRESERLAGVAVGAVNIVRFDGSGIARCDRRPDHIRSDLADYFVLCLPLSARIGMRHDGIESELAPGQFIIVSTLKPIHGAMIGLEADAHYAALFVRIPGPLLRQRLAGIDKFCNQTLEIRPGAGHIMRTLICAALEEARFLAEPESIRFATALVDTISTAIEPQIAQSRCVLAKRSSSAARTLERARAYIIAHLSNPALSAAHVAAHCQVSVRYLHTVFAPTDTTLASFIRESRLLQCQAAFRNPQLRQHSIIEIAGQWGFEDPAHFSRTYKSRFGRTPTQERELARA